MAPTALWDRAETCFGRPRSSWTTVDEMIYDTDSYFDGDREKMREARFAATKESLRHHYEHSRFYNRLCREYDFTPDEVQSEDDLHRVPMVPDTFFKEYPSEDPRRVYEWLRKVTTVDIGEYDYTGRSLQGFLRWAEQRLQGMVNHSSGTTGNYSFMFRDRVTFKRFYYAAVTTLLAVSPPRSEPHYVYPGSPNTYLTLGRWIGEGARIFKESRQHFLTDREITMDVARLLSTGQPRGLRDRLKLLMLRRAMKKGEKKLVDRLQRLDKRNEQTYVIGPPFQIYSVMQRMRKDGVSLSLGDDGGAMVTGGGWKIYEDRKVSEQAFAAMAEETLGIPPERYVDVYGMSEMNGLAVSCEGRYKHLHPWIYPMVLDDNEGMLGYGEWGRFAFLDPVAHSYPGFIITGDRVRLLEECPACGKTGPVLDNDIGRMAGAEAKGCANLMRGLMANELKKAEEA